MAKLFISYSSDDKVVIREIVEDLETLGHSIWLDNKLVGGQSWWDRILQEIENCDFYLCALSGGYLKSDACKRELNYANALSKTIIPIKVISDFDERFLLPEIAELQITDVESGNKKGVLALVQALNTATPSPAAPDPLPTAPLIPVSYLAELLQDINSIEPLNQDQQAALIFKLRDHFRNTGDSAAINQALDKLEARKDLLANIGREVDALKQEIQQTSQREEQSYLNESENPEPAQVFQKFKSVNEVTTDLKEAVETGKTDKAAFGFSVVALLFPVIGIILFFVWRSSNPKRAKLIKWATVAGFIFYLIVISESGSGPY